MHLWMTADIVVLSFFSRDCVCACARTSNEKSFCIMRFILALMKSTNFFEGGVGE